MNGSAPARVVGLYDAWRTFCARWDRLHKTAEQVSRAQDIDTLIAALDDLGQQTARLAGYVKLHRRRIDHALGLLRRRRP